MGDVFDLPLKANHHGQILESDGKFTFGGASTFQEDAKAIAFCVNNHDALVESLILMTDLAEQYAEEMPEATVKASDIIAAKTLLKAIKGE